MIKEAEVVQEQETYSEESPLLETANRVRELEGKYNLIRDRVLIINNNMIDEYKKLMAELKILNDDIRNIKSELFSSRETMKHVIQELELFARKDDVKYLEKYINLWNPMKFVTESDVLRILEDHKKEGKKEHAKHK